MLNFRIMLLGTILTAFASASVSSKEVEEVKVYGIDLSTKTNLDGYMRIALSNEYLIHKYDEKKDEWQYIKPCKSSRRKETNKK